MTFDNVQQAAAALGLHHHHLLTARRLGCISFRNGRVYSAGLIEWIQVNSGIINGASWADDITPEMINVAKARLENVEAMLKSAKVQPKTLRQHSPVTASCNARRRTPGPTVC